MENQKNQADGAVGICWLLQFEAESCQLSASAIFAGDKFMSILFF